MLISVIIPVKDRRETLRRCLASIQQSEFPEYEVIVVDDCSRQDCSDLVAEFGFRTVRLNKHQGAWYARNKGAEQSKGHILVFIDCDMVIPSDALQRIQDHFSQNHYAAISGICGLKTESQSVVTRYKNLWMYHSYLNSPENFDWFISGIGAVKREVFLKVKGFDDTFCTRTGGGDLEFGRRLKEAGHQILLDKNLLGEHLQRYTLISLLHNDFKRSKGWLQLSISKKMFSSVIKKLRIANIYPSYMISILVASIFLFSLVFSFFSLIFIIPTLLSAMVYLVINHPLFRFFQNEGGTEFLFKAIPLSLIDHLTCGLGVVTGGISYLGQSAIRVVLKIGSDGYLRRHYHRLINGRTVN